MWGIPTVDNVIGLHVRITPTCVGNTYSVSSPNAAHKDHPHMCGEYVALKKWVVNIKGSPPHVWGIRYGLFLLGIRYRITPTCVGNTISRPEWRRTMWDHPHMCGEYTAPLLLTAALPGSPPHVWGIRQIPQAKISRSGITPTCVGNTGHRRYH